MSDDLRSCLTCGGRTRPGRWRCDDCQAAADAKRDRDPTTQLEAAFRREHSGPDAEIVPFRIRSKGRL